MIFVTPRARHIFTVASLILLSWSGGSVRGVAQSTTGDWRSLRASDAALRACAAPSADRICAVGDRGLILATDNGGKTWVSQPSYTEANLQGVVFDSEKIGWAVGGLIQPYSHRSVGVLIATRDGGQSWTPIEIPELPRLNGIHSFGGGHLVVWGDWSPTLQSGLIESFDGGSTWSPRAIPASHLQVCAWQDAAHGIVVDRLSRVFYISAGGPPELLELGGNPTQPILAAAVNAAGWWLVGANGQVHWSADGRTWLRRNLPGHPSDHRLITLAGLATVGEHVWMVGTPGNILWHSSNRGLDWEIQSLSTTLPMHCICAATDESLVVAGSLANIQGTRNRGRGWWPVHSAGSRLAMLNVATTVDHVSWDGLAYMANETRHQAAALVIHAQRFHERADAWSDSQHRIAGLGNPLGLAFLEICTRFPIGDLPQGRRASDIAPYSGTDDNPSDVARQVALWIRMCRPDVMVCDESNADDLLLRASSDATRIARRLASDPAFQCFSRESGIKEQTWSCKRVLARSVSLRSEADPSIQRHSNHSYGPTTVLKSTGNLLSQVLAPVSPTIVAYPESGEHVFRDSEARLYSKYTTIHGQTSKMDKDHLLLETANSTETRRPAIQMRESNFQKLMASSHQLNLIAPMLEIKGPDVRMDARWQASLKSFLQSTPVDQHAASLWRLAQGYRLRGYWNRWLICLETLMAEAPRSGVAELACLQALQFLGSDEVELVRLKAHGSPTHAEDMSQIHIQPAFNASPFSQVIPAVQHASSVVMPPNTFIEEYQRLRTGLAGRFPSLQWDPRFLAIDASYQQRPSVGREVAASTAPTLAPLQRLASCHGLYGWQSIGMQEIEEHHRQYGNRLHVRSATQDSNTPYPIRFAAQRPRLDGKLDDPLWQTAVAMPIEDSQARDPNTACVVRMMHDTEFLYIAATCSRDLEHRNPSKRKTESIIVRIDTDRDYLSWFEIQIDEAGQVAERCMDMDLWQPEWYFKTESENPGWRFEAAIPIAQLQTRSVESNSTWSIAIQRVLPDCSAQSNCPSFADGLLLTSARLVHFCDPNTPKP